MGKSSKKKKSGAGKKKQQTSNAEEFIAPYISDNGIRYSGLETPNMKMMGCSLLLPENRIVHPYAIVLQPLTASLDVLNFVRSEVNELVHLQEATVLQLRVTDAESKSMPEVITVTGKCRFTNQCLEIASVAFREIATDDETAHPDIRSGVLKWPDVRSLQLCPVCGNMAQPDDDKEYWMMYYPMVQAARQRDVAAQIGIRLTCSSCLECLVQNVALVNEQDKEPKPIMQFLQEDTPAVAFLDAKTNPILATIPTELTAWGLVTVWDAIGAWEANVKYTGKILDDSRKGGNAWQHTNPNAKDDGQGMLVIHVNQVKEHIKQKHTEESDAAKDDVKQACWTCAMELPPHKVKCCSGCEVAVYCSRACQKADWKEHKKQCLPPL